MRLKKVMVTGMTVVLLVSSALPVSAAETSSDDSVGALIKRGTENLFTYVKENETKDRELKEIVSDSVTVSDGSAVTVAVEKSRVEEAPGDDNYVVAAEDDSAKTASQGNTKKAENKSADTVTRDTGDSQEKELVADNANQKNDTADSDSSASVGSSQKNGTASAGNVSSGNSSPAASGNNNSSNTAAASNSTPAPAPVPEVSAPAPETPVVADTGSQPSAPNYHHTTSIYASDDTTLLRVEYYDENNQMIEYSEVKNFDSATNSYEEYVYSADMTPSRTDTYVNGELSSSTTP